MLTFDFSDCARVARNLGLIERELPFAMSKALNEAAKKTREHLVGDVWPSHVKMKNKSFVNASLRVEPSKASDFRAGRAMAVAVYDRLMHVNMNRLEKGGIKTARGGKVAIPTARVGRGAGGAVRQNQKPRNLRRSVRKGDLIFQANGRGKNSRLTLMYKLQAATRIRPAVPWHAEFNKTMRDEMRVAFPRVVGELVKRNLSRR
ncbi:hypothetical protein OPKNFCMD_5245 [Methylobacterium crusticola]|uniref:Phage morphogenesis protein n=1 Tax=Methylobacterium crusticola TaxID=1697972 RepID=A0ABQ4R5Q6_9HYPH|nr:hypothetical protein [Methylobacterium crusticola]GJD52479.1 hypothetical protein OPKNFCMD_5245 [Methylobacterium crusticola]